MKQWLRAYWLNFKEHWRHGIGWHMLASLLSGILLALFGGAIAANTYLPDGQGREWVAALAGWAGGTGAVLAAIIALPAIRAQVAEAKRQTDFSVGDAEPDLEFRQENGGAMVFYLRIVNWNRRPYEITSVELIPQTGDNPVEFFEHRTNRVAAMQPWTNWERDVTDWTLGNHIKLNGWQDRNGPPAICECKFEPLILEDPRKVPIIFRIEGILGGASKTVQASFDTAISIP